MSRLHIPTMLLAVTLASAGAVASTMRLVSLDAVVRLPSGWKMVEDAGPQGCALETPDGARVEVVRWKLSDPRGDARTAAWEHTVLLMRSCGFRTSREDKIELPWLAQGLRIVGEATDGPGRWPGAFVAFAPEPGEGCVVGCFLPPPGGRAEAAAVLQDFLSRLEVGAPWAPVLAASLPSVKTLLIARASSTATITAAVYKAALPGRPPLLMAARPTVSPALVGTHGAPPGGLVSVAGLKQGATKTPAPATTIVELSYS
ncbi:MAG: hypothetical protein J7M26_05540, partial [Armatimonadetes bacterium]|nr:hypothetical protein [Armatimonadota bacterium]